MKSTPLKKNIFEPHCVDKNPLVIIYLSIKGVSHHKPCHVPKRIVLCIYLAIILSSFTCMWLFENLSATILKSIITWSQMGQQPPITSHSPTTTDRRLILKTRKSLDTNSAYPTCIFTWVSTKISLGKLKMFEIKKGEF